MGSITTYHCDGCSSEVADKKDLFGVAVSVTGCDSYGRHETHKPHHEAMPKRKELCTKCCVDLGIVLLKKAIPVEPVHELCLEDLVRQIVMEEVHHG